MRRVLRVGVVLTVLSAVPTAALAGWTSQWVNTATKPNGEPMDAENSSMVISGGQVRLEQPNVITLIDYTGGRFALVNPGQRVFWRGTVDEYVRELSQSRSTSLFAKLGGVEKKNPKVRDAEAKPYVVPTVDPTKLPAITITQAAGTERIADYDTMKYEFRADGDLFQEVWVAPALDVSGDLNPNRYFAVQRALATGMTGKVGSEYNALYANDEYRKLLEKGFILKMVNHHGGGSFQRIATSIRQADIPASQFEVPAAYRKVPLADVLPAPPKGR
jgi:hypothetical protein